jgi:serine protease
MHKPHHCHVSRRTSTSTSTSTRTRTSTRARTPLFAGFDWLIGALLLPQAAQAQRFVGLGPGTPVSAAAPAAAGPAFTDRLIVRYRDGRAADATSLSRAAITVAANRQGLSLAAVRPTGTGAHLLRASRWMSVEEATVLARNLEAGDARIAYAEPDLILQQQAAPADALFPQQWNLGTGAGGVRAAAAWNRTTGGRVVVGVIDTGVRPHADLVANLLPGQDFISDLRMANDGDARDASALDPGDGAPAGFCGAGAPASTSSWHGTHVAGIVAAAANSTGIRGVAPDARVLPLRALGRCGGYSSDISDAILWGSGAVVAGLATNPTPARVLNLSLGGNGDCGNTMQAAIDTARARGTVVVVAAGNSNASALQSTPANCRGVITVAAVGAGGGKASYSNTGSNVRLAAPGGDGADRILSTLNTGTGSPAADSYVGYVGTSMAAPHVAGVAALVLAVNPKFSPDQVDSILTESAHAFPAACTGCGIGIVDAAAAVALAAGASPAPAPAPAPAPTPTPAPPPGSFGEAEPNNAVSQAQAIGALPATVAASLSSTTDVDHFAFSIPAGRRVTATVKPQATAGVSLSILSSSGRSLASVRGAGGQVLSMTVVNNGTSAVRYAVRVARTGGTAGPYTLTLMP